MLGTATNRSDTSRSLNSAAPLRSERLERGHRLRRNCLRGLWVRIRPQISLVPSIYLRPRASRSSVPIRRAWTRPSRRRSAQKTGRALPHRASRPRPAYDQSSQPCRWPLSARFPSTFGRPAHPRICWQRPGLCAAGRSSSPPHEPFPLGQEVIDDATRARPAPADGDRLFAVI